MSKNLDFSEGLSPWFQSKIGHFPIFLFQAIQARKMSQDILEDKNAFLGYKSKKLKKSKNGDFSKGVSPWFWSKIGQFSIFLFQAIQARKMCFTIFYKEKTPFQARKHKVKKVEKLRFLQRGQPMLLVQNWPFFCLFLFQAVEAGKCLLQYSRRKKRLSKL